MNYKETTNKLGTSRIIKFALIGIGILLFLRMVSFGLTSWLIVLVKDLDYGEQFKVDAYLRIVDLLTVPVSGAIATIITAVIARYGLREASGNVAEGIIHKQDKFEGNGVKAESSQTVQNMK